MKLKKRRLAGGASRKWWLVAISGLMVALLFGTIVVFVPAVSPRAGAATADFMRAIIGPEPVAQLESLSYWLHDTIYRSLSAVTREGPQVTWTTGTHPNPTLTVIVAAPTQAASLELGTLRSAASGGPEPPATATAAPTALPADDVVTAAPQIGWQAYGTTALGKPLMARTLVMVDPDRSYAGVALVRMDLSALQLHIVAGFIEPAHPSGISQLIPDLGLVSPADESQLVAAFNGGFKAVHGHFGMMMNGVTLLPPLDNLATVAVYRDGNVRMGAWGTDLAPTPDMIAFRQNCPPLVENGQLNPALLTDARKAWGLTNNTDVTWRTGLGITQDRRYLIYAVGNGTSVQFLAEALQKAGAYNAMQLDINQFYAHFVTYSNSDRSPGSSGDQLQAQRLLEQMIDARMLYLTPNPRDFFYLTLRK